MANVIRNSYKLGNSFYYDITIEHEEGVNIEHLVTAKSTTEKTQEDVDKFCEDWLLSFNAAADYEKRKQQAIDNIDEYIERGY